MLVFDVTDESSLQNLNQYWLPKILENADENIELALIGNKTDLMNQRVVDREQVDKFIANNQYLQSNRRLTQSNKKTQYEETIISNVNYFEASAT